MNARAGRVHATLFVFVQVLLGDIVFRDFVGVDFFFVGVVGFFDTRYRARLEGVSFFYQFVDAFRIRCLGAGQTLKVFRLRDGDFTRLAPVRLELLSTARSFLLGGGG